MRRDEEPASQAAPPEGVPPPAGTTWFVVGPAKFVFMSVVTFQIYNLYWFYRQWDHVRVATGANIKPAARSLFTPIFCDALFQRILESAEPERRQRLKALWLAIAYIVSLLMFRQPSLASLAGFLGLVPMLVVVRAANDVASRQNPHVSPNRRLTPANLLAIGGPLLLVLGLGWLEFQQGIASGQYLARVAAEENKRLPRFLDDETLFVRTTGTPGLLVFFYRLPKRSASEIDVDRFLAVKTAPITDYACRNDRLLLHGGVTFRYLFMDKNDREIVHIDVTQRNCH